MAEHPDDPDRPADDSVPDPGALLMTQAVESLQRLEVQVRSMTQDQAETRSVVQTLAAAAVRQQAREEDLMARRLHEGPRELAPQPRFYAVARGAVPGVYNTSEEADAQTVGWSGSRQKRFRSRGLAEAYIEANRGFTQVWEDDDDYLPQRRAPAVEDTLEVPSTDAAIAVLTSDTLPRATSPPSGPWPSKSTPGMNGTTKPPPQAAPAGPKTTGETISIPGTSSKAHCYRSFAEELPEVLRRIVEGKHACDIDADTDWTTPPRNPARMFRGSLRITPDLDEEHMAVVVHLVDELISIGYLTPTGEGNPTNVPDPEPELVLRCPKCRTYAHQGGRKHCPWKNKPDQDAQSKGHQFMKAYGPG
jgi:hypothetical protein